MTSKWAVKQHELEVAFTVTIAVVLAVSTLAVALRAYTRFILTRLSALDDYLLIWAQVVLITGCAIWLKMFTSVEDDYGPSPEHELDYQSQVWLPPSYKRNSRNA